MGHFRERVALILLATLLPHCAPSGVPGEPPGEPPDPTPGCVSTQQYFRETAWPQAISRCAGCHVAGGASGGTRFVLKPPEYPDSLGANYEVVKAAAGLTQGGQPLLLLKPSLQVAHAGGEVLPAASPEYQTLVKLVEQLAAPITCRPPSEQPGTITEGLSLLDEVGTLRKASLHLVGRAPTDAELAAVRGQGLDALDPVLLGMMTEPAFYERLKEIFNDVFLTDAFRLESSYGTLLLNGVERSVRVGCSAYSDYYEGVNNGTEYCKRGEEALAREPLEMVAHVVRNDRPLTEILTARYRLVNPASARVLGLSPTFNNSNDYSEFVEVQIPSVHGTPGEYAGVLTTHAFLQRYPNTSSNRNRKRARFFYQYFLNTDVMKNAQRIDLSQVDFAQNPWRNSPLCTTCHTAIDPVAGAFQNWTNCETGQPTKYYPLNQRYCGPGGWYSGASMFAPGTGAGDSNAIASADLPRALEVLAASTTRQQAFAEAMTGHLFAGLTNRPLLTEPVDPNQPGYAALALAHDSQKKQLTELARQFAANQYNVKQLILAILKTPYFRAVEADAPDRLELTGLGEGTLTTPENLHRKVSWLFGRGWGTANSSTYNGIDRNPFYLTSVEKFRVYYGGIDSKKVMTRQTLPGALTSAITQRMAYEMACEYVAVDFAAPRSARRLFPHVDRTLVPSGDPTAPDQADILRNLQYLHARFLGEELAVDDPELLATYDLLVAAQKDGVAAIGKPNGPRATLTSRCSGTIDFATGASVPGASADDPNYVVRAWQAVIAYLMLDYRFIIE